MFSGPKQKRQKKNIYYYLSSDTQSIEDFIGASGTHKIMRRQRNVI